MSWLDFINCMHHRMLHSFILKKYQLTITLSLKGRVIKVYYLLLNKLPVQLIHTCLKSSKLIQTLISELSASNMSDWNHGLCGCFANLKNCLCGYCGCYPCLICTNADGLGESGVLYNVLACFAPCIPIWLLRSKARDRYNIEGKLLTFIFI